MNLFILRLLARRVGMALISLLAVSAIVFAITAVLPGDAAEEQLGQDATPEALAALRTQMGLDVPAPVRYAQWLGGMVTGNAGESLVTRMPVSEAIGSRLPQSLLLAGLTALISVPVALGLGILAAVSVPEFLVATPGLSNGAVGLRLLYEFSRQFAPYIGIERFPTFGNTADMVRASGGRSGETRFVAGVRMWF